MAIALEAFSVVIRREGIERLGGLEAFQAHVPNSTFCADDELARCAFLDRKEALDFIEFLHESGLETPLVGDPEVTLVTAFDGTVNPECEWLQVSNYKQGLIGWRTGDTPRSISAPRTWNPDLDAKLERLTIDQAAARLKFLRREDQATVFWDRETEHEVFVGQAGFPLDAMQDEARQFVLSNLRNPGDPQPLLTEEEQAEFARVLEMLEILLESRPNAWPIHWLQAKANHALGQTEQAYQGLQNARDLEPSNLDILREMAGICLEVGDATQAVSVAEEAAALAPDDPELIANLALAYLLDERLEAATKSAKAAKSLAPHDEVCTEVATLIQDVAAGVRKQPRRLSELQVPRTPIPWWRRLLRRIVTRP